MTKPAPVILLTRPARQAVAFAEILGSGVDLVVSPVIEIQPLPVKIDLKKYSTLIFASQNALSAIANSHDLSGKHAFAVGEKTASSAKKSGMKVVTADGSADSLVAKIISATPEGPMLFLRGRHSSGDIVNRLKNAKLETDSAVVYEQVPVTLSEQAIALLRGEKQVILPLFSARSSSILASEALAAGACAPLILIAMSETVLDAWEGPEPAGKFIAAKPTAASMAEEILRRFHRPP